MDAFNISEQTPKVKGYLGRVVERKRREVAERKLALPEAEIRMRARLERPVRPWVEALRGPGVVVIAEIKRRSPSAGEFAPGLNPAERARLYETHGAAMVSVLTDRDFDGALEDLEAVAGVVDLPVLRKDFLVDPWQVWESRTRGADAALLIVAALDEGELGAVADAAREAGLGLLVEIHHPSEIATALALEPEVIGVNARDLGDFAVDRQDAQATLAGLRREVGERIALVAESGIATAEDVRRAWEAGADAVLVGQALMRTADPAVLLTDLVAAGRRT